MAGRQTKRDCVEPGSVSGSCVVLSINLSLLRLIREAASEKLRVVVRGSGIPDRELLQRTKPKLVVFDDAVVDQSERLWVLMQIRRFAPNANVLYLTTEHTPDLERRVRAAGVAYYGPFDARLHAIAEKLCSKTADVWSGSNSPSIPSV
jgi:DNA-binding NarL/FixJ family response regulator